MLLFQHYISTRRKKSVTKTSLVKMPVRKTEMNELVAAVHFGDILDGYSIDLNIQTITIFTIM